MQVDSERLYNFLETEYNFNMKPLRIFIDQKIVKEGKEEEKLNMIVEEN